MGDVFDRHPLQTTVEAFITATNAFDVDAALALFARDAVIDDPSTGHRFSAHAGIGDYLARYFVGYRTVTRLLSIEDLDDGRMRVRVDFTGDFGHEVGLLDMRVQPDGRIVRIDADLA
jgi:ketosteroid isomerase-like protein